jgi:glucose/arabinose dehydrogenase
VRLFEENRSMMRPFSSLSLLSIAVVLSLFSIARAQDAPADANAAEPDTKPAATPTGDAKGTVVVSGLDNPRAIAIQPGTGVLFISESVAGQIVRFDPTSDKTATPVITGSPLDTTGQPPLRNIGPLGLAFLGRDTLVVGEGGQKTGSDTVRAYAVPATGESIKYEAPTAISGPIQAGDDSKTGEGNFNALVIPTGASLFVASGGGDDAKGWILRSSLNSGKPGELKPFIDTKSLVGVESPMAITKDKGGNLVVANVGKFAGAKDSVLSFFNPATGKLLLKRDTGLYDIMGLAYSPKTKLLYAVDLAWTRPGEGGLYRLGLALGGVAEQAGDVGLALDVGDLREVEVPAVRLRLAGERVLQVLLGLASLQLGHGSLLRGSGSRIVRCRGPIRYPWRPALHRPGWVGGVERRRCADLTDPGRGPRIRIGGASLPGRGRDADDTLALVAGRRHHAGRQVGLVVGMRPDRQDAPQGGGIGRAHP